MLRLFHTIFELCIKGFRILKSYGILHLLQRTQKYLKRCGWRSIRTAEDLNIQYQKWLKKKSIEITSLPENKVGDTVEKISILMPVYNPNINHLKEAVKSIISQDSPHWELCLTDDASEQGDVVECLERMVEKDERISLRCLKENQGISIATNAALEAANSKYVLFMDQDDILRPHAISSFQRTIRENNNPDMIYADEDKIDEHSGRRTDPHFKPEWSPHLLHSFNYIGHPVVIKKLLVKELGGLRRQFDGSQDHDLLLRLTDLPLKVKRIPDILYSWRITSGSTADGWDAKPAASLAGCEAVRESLQRKGFDADIIHRSETGTFDYRIKIQKRDKVSIIIPTKNNYTVLKQCLDSIVSKSTYDNFEVIIVNNGSTDQRVLDYLDMLKGRKPFKILDYPHEFNYSIINNFAVEYAEGKHLLFLNDDTEIISADWMEALLEHSQMNNVGAVGALLTFPDGFIQHAGIVIGMRGSASHAFYRCESRAPGYFNLIKCIRNVSAVTAACLMVEAETFNKASGFNPEFKVGMNDVDLCVRLHKMGFFNIYTPHARLIHHESLTRGDYIDDKEIEAFKKMHIDFLQHGDPYYHPELSLKRNDYSLAV